MRFDGLIHDFLAMSRQLLGGETGDGQGGGRPAQCLRPLNSTSAIDADLAHRAEATARRVGRRRSRRSWPACRPNCGASTPVDKTYCVKRALPRLNVAQEWLAPVRRNVEEVRWLRFAATVAPRQVPAVVADDAQAGIAILELVRPGALDELENAVAAGPGATRRRHRNGRTARRAASRAAREQPELAQSFDNMDLLSALRLEPFFVAAMDANPEVAHRLREAVDHLTHLSHRADPRRRQSEEHSDPHLAAAGAARRRVRLLGRSGVRRGVSVRASVPEVGARVAISRDGSTRRSRRLIDAYEAAAPEPVNERLLLLVPALLIARVDGKSPVEYLNEKVRTKVRATAVRLLLDPPPSIARLHRRLAPDVLPVAMP